MSRPKTNRGATVTDSTVRSVRKGANAVHVRGVITTGPDQGRQVIIAIENGRALELGNNLISVASRNLNEQAEREPPEDTEEDVNTEEEPDETVTHLNFYETIEACGSAAVSPVDISIHRNSTDDWCHVLFNGRIVDQGHIDDVNWRLVGAFFEIQDRPGVGKVPYETRVQR